MQLKEIDFYQAELRDRHHVSATEGQLKRLVQEATSNGEIAPSTKRREKNPWTHEQCNFINSLLANRYDRDEGQDMESWSFWEYAETAMRREFGVQRKAHSIYTWVREQQRKEAVGKLGNISFSQEEIDWVIEAVLNRRSGLNGAKKEPWANLTREFNQ